MESVAQTFSGAVKYNSRVTAVISRNGDLLGDCWLESVMVKAAGSTFYPAEALCKSITVELGGQQLDKITATWMRVYDNLYRNTSTDRSAYKGMTDFVDGEATGTAKRFFTPLLFWFCRSPGNYLPLIALTQLHTAARKSIVPGPRGSGPGKTTWAPYSICQMLVGSGSPDRSPDFKKWGERFGRAGAGNTAKLFGEPVKPQSTKGTWGNPSLARSNFPRPVLSQCHGNNLCG